MKAHLNCILILTLIALFPYSVHAAGFRLQQASDPGHKDLQVGIWYPTDPDIPLEPSKQFGLKVAQDAPIAKSTKGLILISHGFSGWFAGHADTAIALADAGYVVAAPSHTGNTWSDMSSSVDQWLLDRPRHMSRVLDHVLAQSEFSEVIDPARIGVYGFSAGGYTALTLIGGIPDFDVAAQHCVDHPSEYLCAEGTVDYLVGQGMKELPANAWGADPRIKAASIAAPGFGFAFTRDSLKTVKATVQLWSAELDHSVPTSTNAGLLKERLPTEPETHWVKGANHFAFLVLTCREAFKKEDPEEYAFVCNDAAGFDRRDFHDEMHVEMLRFFNNAF